MAHDGSHSRLLQLPRELRDEIYKCLFASTRLSFGQRSVYPGAKYRLKPYRKALAVLRVSRQVNQEASRLWLGHVLFHFEDPVDMLNMLAPLPASICSQIRHLRTMADSALFPTDARPRGGEFTPYQLVWALERLPALRLDRLVVIGAKHGPAAYTTLAGLVQYGGGWKELHFAASDLLVIDGLPRYFLDAEVYFESQPGTWLDILYNRDGRGQPSEPYHSVRIYHHRDVSSSIEEWDGNKRWYTTLDPRAFKPLHQEATTPVPYTGIVTQKGIPRESTWERQDVIVVVKRGCHPGHYHPNLAGREPPYPKGDFGRQTRGMDWAEVKRCYSFATRQYGTCVEDSYDDADEYREVEREDVL